jgi:hypothetical protein
VKRFCQTREFARSDLLAGFTFIACLPRHARVFVEELVAGEWREVFDDRRDQAPVQLSLVTRGAPFRVSCS